MKKEAILLVRVAQYCYKPLSLAIINELIEKFGFFTVLVHVPTDMGHEVSYAIMVEEYYQYKEEQERRAEEIAQEFIAYLKYIIGMD